MSTRRLALLSAFALLLAFASCQSSGRYLDTAPRPMGDQVLRGTVNYPSGGELPADAVLTVRMFDLSRNELLLADHTIERPGKSPVAFQIYYRAEDIRPPRRVRNEARIAFGGRLRLRSNTTTSVGLVTPDNAAQPITLTVYPITGAGP